MSHSPGSESFGSRLVSRLVGRGTAGRKLGGRKPGGGGGTSGRWRSGRKDDGRRRPVGGRSADHAAGPHVHRHRQRAGRARRPVCRGGRPRGRQKQQCSSGRRGDGFHG